MEKGAKKMERPNWNDIQATRIYVDYLENERDGLKMELNKWEELEASICPEDVGIKEYTNYLKQKLQALKLKKHSNQIELLDKYSLFLEEHGYLDTDWRAEEPFAIDEFLNPNP